MSRSWIGEGLGTALLLYVIVGSGIVAEALSSDGAVQLLAHALVVGIALGALIDMFQRVSGSHFNPSVTLAFWRSGEIGRGDAIAYISAQVAGGAVGVALANVTFDLPAVDVSNTVRSGMGQVIAEFVATFVLVLLILSLVRSGRSGHVPAAVGAWVAAVVFATSSTGFANPAVTATRVLTDTFTGIAPVSVAAFVAAQLLAGFGAAWAAVAFHPEPVLDRATT
jgi:glycerol uptake facilitator-like aquaporin